MHSVPCAAAILFWGRISARQKVDCRPTFQHGARWICKSTILPLSRRRAPCTQCPQQGATIQYAKRKCGCGAALLRFASHGRVALPLGFPVIKAASKVRVVLMEGGIRYRREAPVSTNVRMGPLRSLRRTPTTPTCCRPTWTTTYLLTHYLSKAVPPSALRGTSVATHWQASGE